MNLGPWKSMTEPALKTWSQPFCLFTVPPLLASSFSNKYKTRPHGQKTVEFWVVYLTWMDAIGYKKSGISTKTGQNQVRGP